MNTTFNRYFLPAARGASSSGLSPSPPSDGGEGRGEEAPFYWRIEHPRLSRLPLSLLAISSLMHPWPAAGSVLLAFLVTGVRAANFTLNPSADAFVTPGPSGNLSGNNYGGAGALSVAAPGLAQGEFQNVLQFGLATAKSSFDTQLGVGQWTVQAITLQLTAASPNNPIFNANAAGQFAVSLMQNGNWVEGTGTPQSPTTAGITFSTLGDFVGAADENLGTFSFGGGTSGTGTYTLSLTPSLAADVLAGNSVSFHMFAADTGISYLFDSRSFGTASARPLLTITAIPEPDLAALGTSFLALAFSRRLSSRRKRI